jgi:hypothetical protein
MNPYRRAFRQLKRWEKRGLLSEGFEFNGARYRFHATRKRSVDAFKKHVITMQGTILNGYDELMCIAMLPFRLSKYKTWADFKLDIDMNRLREVENGE